jgi:hypothetical protein
MRTIKFRGKRVDGKGWAFGYYRVAYWVDEKDQLQETHLIDDGKSSWKVDPATVGQFTGLLDKNGKEIYEWDKVKSRHGYYVMMYSLGNLGYALSRDGVIADSFPVYSTDVFEVVGNIHDKTPEQ